MQFRTIQCYGAANLAHQYQAVRFTSFRDYILTASGTLNYFVILNHLEIILQGDYSEPGLRIAPS